MMDVIVVFIIECMIIDQVLVIVYINQEYIWEHKRVLKREGNESRKGIKIIYWIGTNMKVSMENNSLDWIMYVRDRIIRK